MNRLAFNTLSSMVLISTVVGLAACSSTPKEFSLAEQIRARADMRVAVAKTLDGAEAKLAKAQTLSKQAAALETEAAEAEKRANDYLKEVKELREESGKLAQESEKLTAEGNAEMKKAADSYQNVNELPKIELPVMPATSPAS